MTEIEGLLMMEKYCKETYTNNEEQKEKAVAKDTQANVLVLDE